MGDGYIVIVNYGGSHFFFLGGYYMGNHDMLFNTNLRNKLVVQDFIGDGLFCFFGGWFVFEGHNNW